MRFGLLSALAMAAVIGATDPASARLIGANSSTAGIYEIDPATGAATLLSTADRGLSLVGLAQIGGTFYVSDVINSPDSSGFSTREINITTGATTLVSDQGGSANWIGLAANRGAGLLYAIDFDSPQSNLMALDPVTGTLSTIGATNISGVGMAYDNVAGILYALGPSFLGAKSLYSVNTSTGVATLIGATGVSGQYAGLAFDEDTNVLYMTADPDGFAGGGSNLYRLDTTTGASTLIGTTGIDTLDGLEWISSRAAAVPVPASVAIFGAALAGLGVLRRRNG